MPTWRPLASMSTKPFAAGKTINKLTSSSGTQRRSRSHFLTMRSLRPPFRASEKAPGFHPCKRKKTEPLENWHDHVPDNSVEWHFARAQANVVLAVMDQCEKLPKGMKSWDLILKPRSVQATKKLSAKSFVLAPSTHRIDVRILGDNFPSVTGISLGRFPLKVSGQSREILVTLQPCTVIPDPDQGKAGFVSPF